MRYALSAARMKAADKNTIGHFGVASLVLQERAALAVCAQIDDTPLRTVRQGVSAGLIRVFAGCGNNGADALAVARLLHQRGLRTQSYIAGDPARATDEFRAQRRSAEAYGLTVLLLDEAEADDTVPEYVIDGLLGVGISREPEGVMASAIREINRLREKGARVIAVDLPSGINADDGTVYEAAVRADVTVTFGFMKTGQLLFPGAAYCGETTVAEIGITEDALLRGTPDEIKPDAVYYGDIADVRIAPRPVDGNKGTFGKVLLVCGSAGMGGAAILAAKAALKSGCGMVRVFTARENRDALLAALPEAIIDVYDEAVFSPGGADAQPDAAEVTRALGAACAWADAVVCGCGIGTTGAAYALLRTILSLREKPLILDADALNLLAADGTDLFETACAYAEMTPRMKRPLILTPHAGEFARLYNRAFGTEKTVADCKAGMKELPRALAGKASALVLFKDARSIVADAENPLYINVSGNDGMATAGSGDVLSGLCGALVARDRGRDAYHDVCAAAFLHGAAGDLAAQQCGKRALTAGDLADALEAVFRIADAGENSRFVAQ